MIERYGRDVMREVWTEENKFRAYLKVEILAAEAWSKLGVVPEEDVKKLWEKATFDIDRIKEIELKTRHDVVAFTRTVSESLGEERKWVHYGLTSTDVVDTANGYIFKQANEILLKDIEEYIEVLGKQALRFKKLPASAVHTASTPTLPRSVLNGCSGEPRCSAILKDSRLQPAVWK